MKILITGAGGMLGQALIRAFARCRPNEHVIGIARSDADLRVISEVKKIIREIQPDVVLHCAARVGGIGANIASPTEFLADNLAIDLNVIDSSRRFGVRQFVYFGSSCMYPRDYRQPLVESDLLAAPLEPTNEGYALAKIAGAKHCEYVARQYELDYRVLIPSNLYGIGDHYGSSASHLVAAAITKAHEAKISGSPTISVWGDGMARREFTFVDDLAEFVVSNIEQIANWPIMMNVGLGIDYSVREFYEAAVEIVGCRSDLIFDPEKPAGMQQKFMDSSVARKFGWKPSTNIVEGMRLAYQAWQSIRN